MITTASQTRTTAELGTMRRARTHARVLRICVLVSASVLATVGGCVCSSQYKLSPAQQRSIRWEVEPATLAALSDGRAAVAWVGRIIGGPKAHTAGGVEHHLGKTETAFQSCLKGRSSRKWTRQTPVTRPLPKDFGLSTLRRKCRKSATGFLAVPRLKRSPAAVEAAAAVVAAAEKAGGTSAGYSRVCGARAPRAENSGKAASRCRSA